ncbi:MAG: PilZ domain-containing protein [Vicinamibacterales bacterium]
MIIVQISPRRPASAFPTISGLRIAPEGGQAVLVNMSTTGVLTECPKRIAPGKSVTVHFEGGFTPTSVKGKVARCGVAGIDKQGTLRYHLGIAFETPISLDAAVGSEPVAETVEPDAVAVRNRW